MNSKSKYTLLLSNTVIFAIGNLLVKLLSFFLMPLYTTVLTTEQYGVAELLNSTVEIVLPIATLSIVEALYRFSIDKEQDHEVLFINSLSIVFIGDLLVIVLAIILKYFFRYEFALEFGLLYCTISFYKLVIQFARGMGHTKRYASYGVLNSLLLVVSNYILLLIFKGGISAYLFSFSIGYGITGIVAFVISKEYFYINNKKINKNIMIEMLNYSIPSIPNMLSWWVNTVSDRYIILLFMGTGEAGLYTAASKLPAIINLVTSIFQQAWQYSTAKEINSGDSKSFFSNVFKAYSFLCVIICAVLIFFNKIICTILFKADFYFSWKFVPILLLAATFGCYATYFGTFYNALKNNKMLMVSTVVGALLNIGLNFILIPFFGGIGASVATAISYAVILIIRLLDVRKKVFLDIDYIKVFIQLFILTFYAFFASFSNTIFTYILGITIILFLLIYDIKIIYKFFKIGKEIVFR
ncbi:oligosaccharide flippase family protein [Streptococcus uberis]